jgi:hypothetical protein
MTVKTTETEISTTTTAQTATRPDEAGNDAAVVRLTSPGVGMFVPAEVRESSIFGKGLFAVQPLAKGTIVCCFTLGSEVITEQQFVQACADGVHRIMRTGTRYAGRYFTVGNEAADYNFINHSFEPNLLSHCGLVLAKRDVAAGEELTLDYRLLVEPSDVAAYDDAATGRPIRGLTARETILRSARELIALLESVDHKWEG